MNPFSTKPPVEESYLRNMSAQLVSVTRTITIPAGAAGVVVEFDFPARPIASASGGDVGGSGDTSIVLGSSSTFDTMVNPKADADLANGEYYVDHVRGIARGKKKDTGTSVSATYNVWAGVVAVEEGDASQAGTVVNGQVTVSSAGTAVPLSATDLFVSEVTIIALEANSTDLVYVGDSGVDSSNGLQLTALAGVTLKNVNLKNVYIDGDNNNNGVSYLGVTRT